MSPTVLCPACGKVVAVKGIPKHTNGCPKWKETFPGTPPSAFNFDRHFKRGLYAEGVVEGEDYVVCRLCPEEHRARRLADHLKLVHGMTREEYEAQFPGCLTGAVGCIKQRQATVQARYGVGNVAQAPEVRALMVENSRAMEPAVRAKRAATNLKRYGHENVFSGEDGARRAQEGMEACYGARNPQQVPEIRERTLKTHVERHGSKFAFTTNGFRERFKRVCREKPEIPLDYSI